MMALVLLLLLAAGAHASPHEDDGHRRPTVPPRLVIDQTAATGGGILTNLRLDQPPPCSKDDALEHRRCDSVSIEGSDVQILTRTTDGGLQSAVGLHNPDGVEANRAATGRPLALFRNGHLIDLERLRAAADHLAQRHPGLTGTMDWDTFLANVRAARPMYGIVRVLVPVGEEDDDEEAHDDGQSRHPEAGHGTPHPRRSRSARDEHHEERCDDDGPWEDAHLPAHARIEVYGSLLFDFVDCAGGRPLDEARGHKLKIPVPLLVNPARPRPDGAVRGLDRLVQLLAPGRCAPAPCTVALDIDAPFQAVPPELRRQYRLATGEDLSPQRYAALPAAARLHLLMPSGYVDGWLTAFSRLGLDQAQWRALGFATRDGDGPFDAAAIHDEAFEDLPALASIGGWLDIHHHLNVSGLVYAPQVLELEQKAHRLREEDDDEHPSHLRRRSREDEDECEDEEEHHRDGRLRARSAETHRPCPPVAAWQYVNGAILVRDAFYLEAHQPGGITLLVNDPGSYSRIRLPAAPGQVAGFRPALPPDADAQHPDETPADPPSRIPPPVPLPGHPDPARGVTLPGQWAEIRPRLP